MTPTPAPAPALLVTPAPRPRAPPVVPPPATLSTLLHTHLPGWSKAPRAATRATRLTTSLTNLVFDAHNAHATPSRVLLRLYGPAFSERARRREEALLRALAAEKHAPAVLASFAGGRVERFIPALPLPPRDVVRSPTIPAVAAAVARLHAFRPPGLPCRPDLWPVLARWVARASVMDADARFVATPLEGRVCKAAVWVDEARRAMPPDAGTLVFCHNDLFRGNILRVQEPDGSHSVQLIDFEYSGYNYRGFDIGNFFMEAMGGSDHGKLRQEWYPSLHVRRMFCTAYLAEFHGTTPNKDDVDQLIEEAEVYGQLSHLFYGFWALAQHDDAASDFPYLKYAAQRFELYQRGRKVPA